MTYLKVLLTTAAILAVAVGCGDDAQPTSSLNVQVIGWGAADGGDRDFQPGLPSYAGARQVQVRLTHPADGRVLETKNFNPNSNNAVLPKLKYGNDLRLEFELLNDDQLPVATGATPLFDFQSGDRIEGFRIQVGAVNQFAPVGAVVVQEGRSTLAQSGFDYRAINSLNDSRWLGRVGHVTVPVDHGNKALVVGGAHVDPARPPASYPRLDIVQNDVMEFDPVTGYFTDLSFDPDTGQARRNLAGRLQDGRAFHTVTRVGEGKFLVIGGFAKTASLARALNSIEVIDLNAPAGERIHDLTDDSGSTSTLNIPRALHTATYRPADNTVVVAGGVGRDGPNDVLESVELINLDDGAVRVVGQMSHPRAEHEAVLMGDDQTVWLLGGRDASGAVAATEVVNGAIGSVAMTPKQAMKTARFDFSALRISPGGDASMVVAVGGYTDLDGQVTASFEFSRLDGDEFRSQPRWRLQTARGRTTAVELPNSHNIVVFGGRDASRRPVESPEVLEFAGLDRDNPYAAHALETTSTDARVDFTATALSNGKLLLVGGYGRTGDGISTLDTAEYFTPLDSPKAASTDATGH